MAATGKRFFKKNTSSSSSNPSPTVKPEQEAPPEKNLSDSQPNQKTKAHSLSDLKEQLEEIQSKISNIEKGETEGEDVKVLYEWSSPAHVFIPRGKKWLTYVVLVTLLIILILLSIREFFIIAPVLAVAFLAYILASVPPQEMEHKITTQGITSGRHSYLWQELYDFWFTQKYGQTILNIDTLLNLPPRLMIIVDEKSKNEVKNILMQIIPYREVPKRTWLDSFADSLSNFFHKLST